MVFVATFVIFPNTVIMTVIFGLEMIFIPIPMPMRDTIKCQKAICVLACESCPRRTNVFPFICTFIEHKN